MPPIQISFSRAEPVTCFFYLRSSLEYFNPWLKSFLSLSYITLSTSRLATADKEDCCCIKRTLLQWGRQDTPAEWLAIAWGCEGGGGGGGDALVKHWKSWCSWSLYCSSRCCHDSRRHRRGEVWWFREVLRGFVLSQAKLSLFATFLPRHLQKYQLVLCGGPCYQFWRCCLQHAFGRNWL